MKIWQTIDKDGTEKTHLTEKPFLYSDMARNKFFGCKETDTALPTFLFPIDLKPLQIAEITVNENGTWSYEIEREEGYYCVKYPDNSTGFWQYKAGKWFYASSDKNVVFMPEGCTISSNRIPDECII